MYLYLLELVYRKEINNHAQFIRLKKELETFLENLKIDYEWKQVVSIEKISYNIYLYLDISKVI